MSTLILLKAAGLFQFVLSSYMFTFCGMAAHDADDESYWQFMLFAILTLSSGLITWSFAITWRQY